MQVKLFSLASLAFFSLAAATPTPQSPSNQCNTGEIQCCESIETVASNAGLATLLTLLGAVVQNVNVPVGVTCTPVTVVGTGSTSCSAQPVCCTNNSFNGVVALGCTPINVNA